MTHLAHPVLPATALCLDTADSPPRRPGSAFRLVSPDDGPSTCQRCNALLEAAQLRREAIAASRAGMPAPTPLTAEQRRELRMACGLQQDSP